MSYYQEALARSLANVEEKNFRSRFKHLQIHNGFRKGELHTLIAEKGGGKSTLVRAWVIDCLLDGKIVFIRLSEDRSQVYKDTIAVYLGQQGEHYLKNLIIDSEIEISSNTNCEKYMDDLRAKIVKTQADIFFLDNFTTSVLSRTNPQKQEQNAVTLRQISMDANIPVIVVAHTEKNFNKKRGIATGDNIRGNMTLANTSAYVYALTIFHELPERPTIFFIDKARHHSSANKKIFMLNFHMDTYKDDRLATFEVIKMIMKEVTK